MPVVDQIIKMYSWFVNKPESAVVADYQIIRCTASLLINHTRVKISAVCINFYAIIDFRMGAMPP